MKTTIYQIQPEKDIYKDLFGNSEFLLRNKHQKELEKAINIHAYSKVYETNYIFNSLDEIFFAFNVGPKPEHYEGHSVSISDIIKIENSKYIENGIYFVDTFGFKKIEISVD